MPHLATVLKDEVRRATRLEFRKCAVKMKAMVIAHDQAIAAMTKKMQQLERELMRLRQANHASKNHKEDGVHVPLEPFSPKELRSYRRSLELSADQFASLLGVSAQSIYSWELGRVQPRPRQIAAVNALRSTSKKEIHQRIAKG